jgi:hypothetical protein
MRTACPPNVPNRATRVLSQVKPALALCVTAGAEPEREKCGMSGRPQPLMSVLLPLAAPGRYRTSARPVSVSVAASVGAATAEGIDPDRLAFTITLRAVRRWITTAATAAVAVLADARTVTLTEISRDHNHRRNRTCPCAVKRSQAPYPAKRHAGQQTSTTVDYHIEVIPHPHA